MTGKWWALVVWSVLVVATFLLGGQPGYLCQSALPPVVAGLVQEPCERVDQRRRANQTTRPHLAMTRFHSRAAARTAGSAGRAAPHQPVQPEQVARRARHLTETGRSCLET